MQKIPLYIRGVPCRKRFMSIIQHAKMNLLFVNAPFENSLALISVKVFSVIEYLTYSILVHQISIIHFHVSYSLRFFFNLHYLYHT